MEILTGNELMSGATVYLDREGRWVEDLQQARVFRKEEAEAREAALAATRQTLRIVSLEIETVTVRGSPETMSRPRISASGSSVMGNAEPMVILTSSAVRSPTA